MSAPGPLQPRELPAGHLFPGDRIHHADRLWTVDYITVPPEGEPVTVRLVGLGRPKAPREVTGLCLRDTAADGRPAVSWVITGGESGQNARPSNPQWFRDIRDQCVSAGVSYFHKQNGEFAPVTEIDLTAAYYTFRDGETVRRVGKKAAGRLLDGVEWSEKPYG